MLQAGLLSELAISLSQSLKCSSASRSRNDCFTPRMLDKARETLGLMAVLIEMEGAATFWEPTIEQISSIASCVVQGKAEARKKAVLVLSSIEVSEEMKRKVGVMEGFMGGLLQVITSTPKAGVTLLLEVCSSRKNRVMAIEAGAVGELVGLLACKEEEMMTTELILKGLKAFCAIAEGRSAMCMDNAKGIREVIKVMNSESERATRYAVEVLWLVVSKEPGTQAKRSALQEGAFAKVMAVAHIASSPTTKMHASGLLRALSEALPSLPNSSHLRLP